VVIIKEEERRMKKLLAGMLGVAAVLFGGCLLLTLLPWAAIQHPGLGRAAYWSAFLGRLFGPALGATATGLAFLFVGVGLSLQVSFPFGSRPHSEVAGGAALFWGLVGLGTAGLFLLLVGINFMVL
jgi:hypothetical protein